MLDNEVDIDRSVKPSATDPTISSHKLSLILDRFLFQLRGFEESQNSWRQGFDNIQQNDGNQRDMRVTAVFPAFHRILP